jgi:predicted transcriptional regulator
MTKAKTPDELSQFALLDSTGEAIVQFVTDNPGCTVNEVVAHIGAKHRMPIMYRLLSMNADGTLLVKKYGGKIFVYPVERRE